jgi:hypothetical protein
MTEMSYTECWWECAQSHIKLFFCHQSLNPANKMLEDALIELMKDVRCCGHVNVAIRETLLKRRVHTS